MRKEFIAVKAVVRVERLASTTASFDGFLFLISSLNRCGWLVDVGVVESAEMHGSRRNSVASNGT